MPVSYLDLGLTKSEYDKILDILQRRPSDVELYMYSLMWSEHCSYKHSRATLRRFPTTSPKVLMGPGQNAGIIDIGDGLAAVFKIESHNHPSAIEPYQGAATGVGGIVRDIFSMGARPVALMNSLRFGPLSEPRQRYLFEGAVAGIGGYGNCIGVPTIGGEAYFDESYAGNCLVNAFCLGLIKHDEVISATAKGPGNLVILFGAKTGRDGIGGASILASQEFDEKSEEKRPSVQVGDPFVEKLLIEASLELLDKGLLVALQDLGAAGLTSAASEMASKGDVGITIDVSRVPIREKGMFSWEIMVSESQERMLAVVTPELKDKVFEVCKKWELNVEAIGTITDDGMLKIYEGDQIVAEMPAHSLAEEAPLYHPEHEKPAYLNATHKNVVVDFKETAEKDFLNLLKSPNICGKQWIWQQYDHQVGLNTIIIPGADAAVIRIKGTGKALAMTTDGNGRHCYLDPLEGGKATIMEAARNLICVGAEPLAATDCLNFGSPEKKEIFYQFKEAVEGMSQACEALGVPVISGNVSFYNESYGNAIFPTPIVGMVGLIENSDNLCFPGLKSDSIVYMVGETADELGGTEYLKTVHGKTVGKPPAADLQLHIKNAGFILDCIASGSIDSCHDISDGGLVIALAEACLKGNIGLDAELPGDRSLTTDLFAESHSRYIISIDQNKELSFIDMANQKGIKVTKLGRTSNEQSLKIKDVFSLPLTKIGEIYNNSLQKWVEHGSA